MAAVVDLKNITEKTYMPMAHGFDNNIAFKVAMLFSKVSSNQVVIPSRYYISDALN
jgi:hypothetical protein